MVGDLGELRLGEGALLRLSGEGGLKEGRKARVSDARTNALRHGEGGPTF